MREKKAKGYRWLFVVLILLAAVAGGLYFLGQGNLRLQEQQTQLEAARQQLAALKLENTGTVGEVEAAQRKLEEAERQNDALQAELETMLRQIDDYADRYGALADASSSG